MPDQQPLWPISGLLSWLLSVLRMLPTELSTGDFEFQLFVSGGRYCVCIAFLVGYADTHLPMANTVPSPWICVKISQAECYDYPHFSDEETESRRGCIQCPYSDMPENDVAFSSSFVFLV